MPCSKCYRVLKQVKYANIFHLKYRKGAMNTSKKNDDFVIFTFNQTNVNLKTHIYINVISVEKVYIIK